LGKTLIPYLAGINPATTVFILQRHAGEGFTPSRRIIARNYCEVTAFAFVKNKQERVLSSN